MSDLSLRLSVAKSVAMEAGQLARRRFLARKQGDYALKGHQDYLTETDGEVERFIIASLTEAFPGDSFIGEEGGGAAGEGTWIIDPIDGTSNFARGVPHFCVSIGFFRNGRPEVGVIAAPMQDELYAAALGLGATLNGLPLAASSIATTAEANVEIGWNSRRPTAGYLALVSSVMTSGASIRRAGSGALGLVYVAAGRSDGYAETHINAWDVAAGLVIATEAGARVNDFFAGNGLAEGNAVLVACPGLADALSGLTGIALKP